MGVGQLAVKLIAGACVALGLYFGFLFGSLEHEEIARRSVVRLHLPRCLVVLTGVRLLVVLRCMRVHSHIEVSLERDNDYGYPLAALLGGVVGFVIQFIRLQAPVPIEMRFMSDQGDSL